MEGKGGPAGRGRGSVQPAIMTHLGLGLHGKRGSIHIVLYREVRGAALPPRFPSPSLPCLSPPASSLPSLPPQAPPPSLPFPLQHPTLPTLPPPTTPPFVLKPLSASFLPTPCVPVRVAGAIDVPASNLNLTRDTRNKASRPRQ